jgi:hypothetical protein
MKYLSLILWILVVISTYAQSESDVKTALFQMRSAMLDEDEPTLRALTSEHLTYGHSSGVIETQEQFLAVFASGKTDYQNWDIYDLEITFPKSDLALIRHKVNADINSNHLELGLLMVWTKEKGQWKLLARQAFRLPQPTT